MIILDPISTQIILFVVSVGILHNAVRTLASTILGQMRFKELLHGVRVPLGDGQRLLNFTTGIKELNHGIQAPYVLDLQVGEFGGPAALDEGLNLGIGPELAGAHLQNGLGICSLGRRLLIQSATLLALGSEIIKLRLNGETTLASETEE